MYDEMVAARSADVMELKSDGLTHEALHQLAMGDALVLHVRQFIDPSPKLRGLPWRISTAATDHAEPGRQP